MLARLTRPRTHIAAIVAVALTLLVSTATASAQGGEAEWAFVPAGIFRDDRVQMSMRLQMDTAAAAEAGGIELQYHGGRELPPAEDAELLLAAAGIVPPDGGEVSGLEVQRSCRAWAATDSLVPIAEVLGRELARVWGEYGLDFSPCEITDDPTQADILVFAPGESPPKVDLQGSQDTASFLAYEQTSAPGGTGGGPAPAPAQGSGGTEGSGPTPVVTGSLGETSEGNRLPIALALGLVSAAVVMCARWASAPRGVR